MVAVDAINQVLDAFGKSISLSGLTLDDNLSCVLCVDKEHTIQLTYKSELETLIFFADIGVLGDCDVEQTCNTLLKANATWNLMRGCVLAKKPRQSSIILLYPFPIVNLTLAVFESAFEFFINQTKQWKNYLLELEQGQLSEPLAELCMPVEQNPVFANLNDRL